VLNLTYIQVIRAEKLVTHASNTRGLAEEMRQERGAILTSDMVVLARSVPSGDSFVREYPQETLAAHIVGYHDDRYGRAGIEGALNETLAGRRSFSRQRRRADDRQSDTRSRRRCSCGQTRSRSRPRSSYRSRARHGLRTGIQPCSDRR